MVESEQVGVCDGIAAVTLGVRGLTHASRASPGVVEAFRHPGPGRSAVSISARNLTFPRFGLWKVGIKSLNDMINRIPASQGLARSLGLTL